MERTAVGVSKMFTWGAATQQVLTASLQPAHLQQVNIFLLPARPCDEKTSQRAFIPPSTGTLADPSADVIDSREDVGLKTSSIGSEIQTVLHVKLN